jgi:hypothetical protein
MQSLKDLEKYTLNKKKHQLDKKDYFETTPIQKIRSFIQDNEDDTSVSLAFDFISTWHHADFIFSFLKNRNAQYEKNAISTCYAIESNLWDYFLGKKYPAYDEAILFHISIKHMSQALLLGWDRLGISYGKLLLKMLYGKQYKGWHPVYKHPWFMLEIFCKWQNIRLDYTKLNYPEDMGIYQDVIDNWDTKDTDLLSRLVNRMVQFHIEQSDEYEYNNRTPDFSSSDYFIYAIEILLWLNIRERMELPDYLPDNELMKLPVNNWYTQKTEIPVIELIKSAKSKLVKNYPGIEFEII